MDPSTDLDGAASQEFRGFEDEGFDTGFVFDLGIDQHRRGRIQLEEAVDMIDRAHDGVPEDEKVVFILSES